MRNGSNADLETDGSISQCWNLIQQLSYLFAFFPHGKQHRVRFLCPSGNSLSPARNAAASSRQHFPHIHVGREYMDFSFINLLLALTIQQGNVLLGMT